MKNGKTLSMAEFGELVDRRFESAKQVLITKGKEYATTDHPTSSFHEQSELSIHTTPTAIGWELLVKHLYSIRRIIREYEQDLKIPSQALIDEKFGDAINYLILIEALFKELGGQKGTTNSQTDTKLSSQVATYDVCVCYINDEDGA